MSCKIGIISLNINGLNLNIGAVLHSYAFQKYVDSFKNVSSEIIDYIPQKFTVTNLMHPITYYLKRRDFVSIFLHFLNLFSFKRKKKKLQLFVKSNMIFSSKKYSYSDLSNAKLNYDRIVCESDIIWSPEINSGNFDEAFFLNLDSMKNAKKISYAASLGNCNFTDNNKSEFKRLIEDFSAISCRETFAVEFTKKFTNLKVEHVLDPVFLLPQSHYKTIMSRRLVKKNYVLFYSVGKYKRHSLKIAKKYAVEHNLKFVEISKFSYHKLFNKTYSSCGVEEFLSLIYYADTIFSDSFHCTAFSIVFNKNFYVVEREGQEKKILDLCKLFGLADRVCSNETYIKVSNNSINYNLINPKIISLIDKSKQFVIKNIINCW